MLFHSDIEVEGWGAAGLGVDDSAATGGDATGGEVAGGGA